MPSHLLFDTKSNMQRDNLEYSEELYQLYLENPSQVPDSWRWFFQGMQSVQPSFAHNSKQLLKELKVFQLFRAYRDHGNLKAKLDPLGRHDDKGFPKLESFGITKKDLEQHFDISQHLFQFKKPLKEVITFLEKTYCESLSLQVGSCHPKIRHWFFEEFEKPSFSLNLEDKKAAFSHLVEGEILEKFLHLNFIGKKRFSLEGLDVLIPSLEYLLEKGTQQGITDLVIGMAHRGRLNLLINLMKKDPQVLFSEFEGHLGPQSFKDHNFTGDVKYHLGFCSQRTTKNGNCSIYLGYNPSHLEAVNPVICGMTRALQRKNKDTKHRKSVIPVLIHGDAAFCGQGSTSETLQLSQLKGYTTGGSLHIILNNQVGFTTQPADGRSTLFASDLAKSIKAPVLLVNANDVHACLKAIDIAVRFRQEFAMDVFIDLIGYRRHGHNEGDEPSFTQPNMYKIIKSMPTVCEIYKKQLLQDQVITEEESNQISKNFHQYLENSLKEYRKHKPEITTKDIIGIPSNLQKAALKTTQVSEKKLKEVFEVITKEPASIQLHPKVKKLIEKRKQKIQQDQLDWALCELACYGSLMQDGFSIRLSGQDCIRGTFSHRHIAYYDNKTEKLFSPLKEDIGKHNQQECCLYNSPLSEMAVLGFEYGNSCLAPDFLTLWEAQFGDFVNGAQIIIDQFISSGEIKWLQKTDITMLLPHAYEGQGPEHSSAYLERFLQLCAEDNMRVCNISSPANFFHVLRRQKTLLKNRKPLILMTPKSLLRHPEAISSRKDLTEGRFEEILWDKSILDARDINTLVLCSGKVYYDWMAFLKKQQISKKNFATFRIEQLYPFPANKLNPIVNGFPNFNKILWLQEESKNRGAWFYIKDQLESLFYSLGQNIKIQYVGRPKRAATAEGSEAFHKLEQERIMKKAYTEIQ